MDIEKYNKFLLNQSKYSIRYYLSGKIISPSEAKDRYEQVINVLKGVFPLIKLTNPDHSYPKDGDVKQIARWEKYPNVLRYMNLSINNSIRINYDNHLRFYLDKQQEKEQLSITPKANLFSRQVDYSFGRKNIFPLDDDEIEESDFYDRWGIFRNELPALLNNLMLENSLRKLSQGLDMEVEEWTSESTVNSPLIWKYGFKLDEWQMYDPKKDDLFPNSSDLIEAYLEGRAEELRKKTLKRRLKLMKKEDNKLFYEAHQKELEKRMDKETTNEAERDQFTDEQLAEIAELIEENIGLKK